MKTGQYKRLGTRGMKDPSIPTYLVLHLTIPVSVPFHSFQVQCEAGSLLQVNDEQIYSLKEKLPRKVQVKVKVGHSQCIHSQLAS